MREPARPAVGVCEVTGSLSCLTGPRGSGRKANVCKNLAMPSDVALRPPDPWREPDPHGRHRVAVLALDGVVAFELGLPHRFLSSRSLLPGWPEDPRGVNHYDVQLCTVDNGSVRTSAGYAALPTADRRIVAAADTVIVPGIDGHPVSLHGVLSDELRSVLASARRDVRWMSICTGAFVLAAFGLLDGRRATTHWAHADRFAQFFPQVDLDAGVLFVDSTLDAPLDADLGATPHPRRILTSAGNAAGIDALLHLVRTDLGAEAAAGVARGAVVAPWRDGGQAQFIDHRFAQSAGSAAGVGGSTASRNWALDHLGNGVDLGAMARHAGVSVRTFTRRFREETGETVGSWLIRARVDRARHLLETTDLAVDLVAEQAGFGTAASLRQQLTAAVGLSPSSYRRRFRADTG